MSNIDLVLRELRQNVEYAHRALPGLRREVMKVGVDHPDRRYAEDVVKFAVKLGEQSAVVLAMLDDVERLRETLRGVIRVADRDCPEFRAAHAALEGRATEKPAAP